MNEKQFKNFKEFIKVESGVVLDSFLAEEIELQPRHKDFLEGILESEFYRSFFMRGFMEGITWEKENKDTKFIF